MGMEESGGGKGIRRGGRGGKEEVGREKGGGMKREEWRRKGSGGRKGSGERGRKEESHAFELLPT